jgi:hypothetical protein
MTGRAVAAVFSPIVINVISGESVGEAGRTTRCMASDTRLRGTRQRMECAGPSRRCGRDVPNTAMPWRIGQWRWRPAGKRSLGGPHSTRFANCDTRRRGTRQRMECAGPSRRCGRDVPNTAIPWRIGQWRWRPAGKRSLGGPHSTRFADCDTGLRGTRQRMECVCLKHRFPTD